MAVGQQKALDAIRTERHARILFSIIISKEYDAEKNDFNFSDVRQKKGACVINDQDDPFRSRSDGMVDCLHTCRASAFFPLAIPLPSVGERW